VTGKMLNNITKLYVLYDPEMGMLTNMNWDGSILVDEKPKAFLFTTIFNLLVAQD